MGGGEEGPRGNVVNRFVRLQLDTLAAGVGEGVDHMGLDLQQAEFEHLKQPDRAGTDDDRIGFNRTIVCGGGIDHCLIELRFHGVSVGGFERAEHRRSLAGDADE